MSIADVTETAVLALIFNASAWANYADNAAQPKDDGEALVTMHAARVAMATLPAGLREYSRAWLAERKTGRAVLGVGISVNAPAHRAVQANAIRFAMSEAVTDAIREGVDLACDSVEIKRRMMAARARA